MRLLIKPQAISWEKRAIKVCGAWAEIGPCVNLKQIRVGEDQYMEIVTRLDGKKCVEKVYSGGVDHV